MLSCIDILIALVAQQVEHTAVNLQGNFLCNLTVAEERIPWCRRFESFLGRMNESQMQLLARRFNLRNLNKTCNYRECRKLPNKEITLIETDLITKERKNVASLYFCTEHHNKITKNITTELNEIANKRWVIGKKEFDIGFITH